MTSYIRSIEVIVWWKESVILSSVSWGMALFCDSMGCDCSFSLKVIDSDFYHVLYSIYLLPALEEPPCLKPSLVSFSLDAQDPQI